jgi:two-component system CheB/CheR fusion protein
VVDHDLRIRIWNKRAEELWGLRTSEVVGQHFLNLDIGLPFERVRPLLRQALEAGGQAGEVELEAVNRRGRPILVRVACTPLEPHDDRKKQGAIIAMESSEPSPSTDKV